MATTQKRKWAGILLVCILATSFLCSQLDTLAWFSPGQSSGVKNHMNGTLVPSAPLAAINITGNGELDAFSNKTGGNGTSWAEAYIIENFEITVAEIDPCVRIQDTSRFLVIRNCTFTCNFAIVVRFDNCSNIKLEGSRIFASQFSYQGLFINRSSNVLASSNNFTNPSIGIMVHDSNDTSISGNRITGTYSHAIQVNMSRSCNISNNALTSFRESGILVDDSSSLNISSNYISSVTTTWGGILIRGSNGCNITANNVSWNNAWGINIQTTTACRLLGNNVTNNQGNGIAISISGVSLIASNNVSFNTNDGIYMYDGASSIIQGNDFTWNGGIGVNIDVWNQVTFVGNTLVHNTIDGLSLYQSESSICAGNNASLNNLDGMQLSYCTGCVVSTNFMADNGGSGLSFYLSYTSNVSQNTIERNYNGIELDSDYQCRVFENIIANNTNEGVIVIQSSDHRIYLNLFEGNNPQASVQDPWEYTYFDNGTYGNYWSDYTTANPDAYSNGVFWDQPYYVGSMATDNYPLATFFDPDMSGRISIDGNAELAANADSGNGSSNNPYIIANKPINVYLSGACISIRNTNLHLRIEDCTFTYAGYDWNDAGVYLENVSYATISSCSFIGCVRGVFINNVNDSMISGNNFTTTGAAIDVRTSTRNRIDDNWINASLSTSISVQYSTEMNVTGNILLRPAVHGIWTYNSNQSEISDNYIENATEDGLNVHGHDLVILSNNITALGISGIYIMSGSTAIQFDGNMLEECGFYFETTVSAELASMTVPVTNTINEGPIYFYYNIHEAGMMPTLSAGQIILVNCSNAFIQYQTLVNCTIGISVYYSSAITLFHNDVSGNTRHGIYVVGSTCINVTENIIYYNDDYGIALTNGINNTIDSNTGTWNGLGGISIESSNGTLVNDNNCTHNIECNLYIAGSSENNIIDNDLSHCNDIYGQQTGIYMSYCSGNLIFGNNLSGNINIGYYASSCELDIVTGNHFNDSSTGIYITNSQNMLVDANWFLDCSTSIELIGTTLSNVTGNFLSGTSSVCISINSYCQYILINGNTFVAGTTCPLRFYYCSNAIVCDNRGLVSNSIAFILYRVSNGLFINNTITTPVLRGMDLSDCTNITIRANVILGGQYGIYIVQSTGGNVTTNRITSPGYTGIYAESSSNLTLYRNDVNGGSQNCIYLTDASGAWIEGNNATGSAANGINVEGSDHVTIAGNNASGNANQGIRLITCNQGSIHDNYASGNPFGGINVDGNLNLVIHNFVDFERDIYATANNQMYENYYLLEDTDGDGLLGRDEFLLGTSPVLIDTDNDNFLDGYEVRVGTDPLNASDTPVLPQVQYDAIVAMVQGQTELINIVIALLEGNWTYLQAMQAQLIANITAIEDALYVLDDVLSDRDCDGLADVYEIGNGTNPLRIDSDLDTLGDAFEFKIGTDPLDDDSDGDGYLDGQEFNAGTDPLDAADHPGAGNTGVATDASAALAIAIIGLSVAGVAMVSLVLVVKKNSKSREKNLPN